MYGKGRCEMGVYEFGYKVACLLALFGKISSFRVNGTHAKGEPHVITSFQEYVVEHDISTLQAKNAALAIDLNSIELPAGCQKCTKKEIAYCQGRDFINDHCCCDKRYHEVLPYVPHTCYLGIQLCKPIAGDCSTYHNIRKCCCSQHVLKIWKSAAASNSYQTITVLLLIFFIISHIVR